MDIEGYIEIEEQLNNYFIPEITNIIILFLGISYEQIIQRHITIYNQLSRSISFSLREAFDIDYHIEFEVFNMVDHLESWECPDFIYVIYNLSPQLDVKFEIIYHSFVWGMLGGPEPDTEIDCW